MPLGTHGVFGAMSDCFAICNLIFYSFKGPTAPGPGLLKAPRSTLFRHSHFKQRLVPKGLQVGTSQQPKMPNMAQLGTQNAPKMEPQTPLQSNFFHLGGKPENEQQYSGFACFFMSGETPGRPNFLKKRCLKAKGFPSVF